MPFAPHADSCRESIFGQSLVAAGVPPDSAKTSTPEVREQQQKAKP